MPGRPDVDPKGEGDPKGIPGVETVDLARRSMPGRTSDRRVKGDPDTRGNDPEGMPPATKRALTADID